MSDGTDEGRFAAVSCPGNDLRVEDPEVFPTAAATGHNDGVHFPAFIQPIDGGSDLFGGFKALHVDRAEQQPHRRPAAGDDVADILQRSSRFAGNDPDAFGVSRQRLFVLWSKQALLFQLCFQLLKGQLCRADAIRKHIVDIDLKCTIPLIKGGTAADDDFHSLFRAEAKPPRVRAEHNRFHTAGLIPEGKIAVSAPGILHKISDLTSQRQIKQNVVCIQKCFDILVQGGNRDHFSHNPASRAARIETPMALSLEYCPGTK